jgi:hypothetical protein
MVRNKTSITGIRGRPVPTYVVSKSYVFTNFVL